MDRYSWSNNAHRPKANYYSGQHETQSNCIQPYICADKLILVVVSAMVCNTLKGWHICKSRRVDGFNLVLLRSFRYISEAFLWEKMC